MVKYSLKVFTGYKNWCEYLKIVYKYVITVFYFQILSDCGKIRMYLKISNKFSMKGWFI